MAESRQEAVRRMERQAEILGANAVVCTRLVTAMVMQGSAEMLAYGTAVILEDYLKAKAWESLIGIYPDFQKYQDKTDMAHEHNQYHFLQ